MIATATLLSSHKVSGLLLPAEAVLHDIDQTTYVFIADREKIQRLKGRYWLAPCMIIRSKSVPA